MAATHPSTYGGIEMSPEEIIRELRGCIADMRAALTESLIKDIKVNAANLLNESTDTSIKYQCYHGKLQNNITE